MTVVAVLGRLDHGDGHVADLHRARRRRAAVGGSSWPASRRSCTTPATRITKPAADGEEQQRAGAHGPKDTGGVAVGTAGRRCGVVCWQRWRSWPSAHVVLDRGDHSSPATTVAAVADSTSPRRRSAAASSTSAATPVATSRCGSGRRIEATCNREAASVEAAAQRWAGQVDFVGVAWSRHRRRVPRLHRRARPDVPAAQRRRRRGLRALRASPPSRRSSSSTPPVRSRRCSAPSTRRPSTASSTQPSTADRTVSRRRSPRTPSRYVLVGRRVPVAAVQALRAGAPRRAGRVSSTSPDATSVLEARRGLLDEWRRTRRRRASSSRRSSRARRGRTRGSAGTTGTSAASIAPLGDQRLEARRRPAVGLRTRSSTSSAGVARRRLVVQRRDSLLDRRRSTRTPRRRPSKLRLQAPRSPHGSAPGRRRAAARRRWRSG